MPIYIKRVSDNATVAKLAEGNWELPYQVDALEQWLNNNHNSLRSDEYIADIGFSIRDNSCGGGTVLSAQAMAKMSRLGINLWLSEYLDD